LRTKWTNGVDNGTISFDYVVIPKENMLDRFVSVNDKGEFESPIPSDRRFFYHARELWLVAELT
jgi:acyl-CoA oxidase